MPTDHGDSPGDLERLIAAEAQIASRTAKAVSEARALIALAQVRVEEFEGRARGELEETRAALEQEMVQDREGQLQAIAGDLQRRLGSLEAISEERITELARKLLDLLLQPGSAGRENS